MAGLEVLTGFVIATFIFGFMPGPAIVYTAAQTLADLGRMEEALAVYDERIAEQGSDSDTTLDLRLARARLALDIDSMHDLVERLEELGGTGAEPWNNLAWSSMVAGRVDDRARAAADKAVRLSAGRSTAVLNTQAAIQALQGEPETARKTLLQSMQVARRHILTPRDWYVAGLIAEAYGLMDSARHAYEQADRAPLRARASDSPAELARIRLEALRAPAP